MNFITIYFLIPLIIIIAALGLNIKYKWYTKKDYIADIKRITKGEIGGELLLMSIVIYIFWPIFILLVSIAFAIQIINIILLKILPN